MTLLKKILVLARMVKIEHSVFALPFAYVGAFTASGGWPGWRVFLLLTLAMVAVRSFAMGFNRLADRKFDALNPRTQDRPLVTGEITRVETYIFLLAMAAIFVLACGFLNKACLILSPFALAVCAGYSYTKRFTWLCHFWLGLVLALAPLAGWLAALSDMPIPAVLFAWGVLFWVAGFDILYACQDIEFDTEHKLHSLPVRYGLEAAFPLAAFCHVATSIFFLMAGWSAMLAWPYYLVWAVVSIVLFWEHHLLSPKDLSRINLAFFTLNGVISVVLFLGVLASLYA